MEEESPVHAEATRLTLSVIDPQKTREDVTAVYDKWNNYDEHMDSWAFNGPRVAAQGVINHAPNKDVYILDVAAGTGPVAIELRKAGFTNVDALDPSEGMLQIAKDKNLYKNYLKAFFTDNVECVATNTYDVLVESGGMTQGHLKVNTLPEMIRCVKPGGLVVLNVTLRTINEEYKDKLLPLMEQLQTEGQWQQIEKTYIEDYMDHKPGFLFVFKVTKAA